MPQREPSIADIQDEALRATALDNIPDWEAAPDRFIGDESTDPKLAGWRAWARSDAGRAAIARALASPLGQTYRNYKEEAKRAA